MKNVFKLIGWRKLVRNKLRYSNAGPSSAGLGKDLFGKVRVGVFLMQKDESDLFPIFIKYYGEAFGYGNIHVFDNGSAPSMDSALSEAQSLGVQVNFDYSSPQDFEQKGRVLGAAINANQENYDVFLPLDCDEFIGLQIVKGAFTCDPQELSSFFGALEPGAYRTQHRFRSHLSDLSKFYQFSGSPKLFFVKTPVKGLDVGLHFCSEPAKVSASPLCHFEFHNKPFELLEQHARNKMSLRINLEDTTSFENYSGDGKHLVPYLLEGAEAAYHARLDSQNWFSTHAVLDSFIDLELNHPFYREYEDTKHPAQDEQK